MLQQFRSMSSRPSIGLRTNVDQIVTVIVSLPHNRDFGLRQQRQHLLEVPFPAFRGELAVELDDAASDGGPPTVRVAARRGPGSIISLLYILKMMFWRLSTRWREHHNRIRLW